MSDLPRSGECAVYGRNHEDGDCKMCKQSSTCAFYNRPTYSKLEANITTLTTECKRLQERDEMLVDMLNLLDVDPENWFNGCSRLIELDEKVKWLEERNVVLNNQNYAFEKHWVPKNTLKAAEVKLDQAKHDYRQEREHVNIQTERAEKLEAELCTVYGADGDVSTVFEKPEQAIAARKAFAKLISSQAAGLAYYHSPEYAAKLQKQMEPIVKERDDLIKKYNTLRLDDLQNRSHRDAFERERDAYREALESISEDCFDDLTLGYHKEMFATAEQALKDHKPVKLQPGES